MRTRRRSSKPMRKASVRRRYAWLIGGWKWAVLVVVLVLLGWGVWSWRQLTSLAELAAPTGDSHGFVVTENERWVRLLVVDEGRKGELAAAMVVSWDRQSDLVSLIFLPKGLSDGEVSIQRFWQAGYYKELQQAVEHQIGLPLTDYVISQRDVDGDGQPLQSWYAVLSGEQAVGWWDRVVGLPRWLAGYPAVKTSISSGDFLKLVGAMQGVDLDKVSYRFAESEVEEGQAGVTLLSGVTDRKVAAAVSQASFAEKPQSVEIKNATSVNGLAALMGRYVTVMGGEVVATVAADTPQSESLLISSQATPFTEELSRLLGIPLKIQGKTGRERSDIELVLGEDVIGRLGQ